MQTKTTTFPLSTIGSYPERVLRKPEVLKVTGLSSTVLYEQTRGGLFPTSMALGSRAIGYLSSEITAIVTARAAGYDDERIRELVKLLMQKRKESASALMSSLVA
ncbi:helix-turn-helix transcriptional regulator [Glaciecola petra]|uniref:AlpA family phage regulatory protein n=1 Tax=Glaciecola petra TaxID=3075602 RepID=A0ABU2ZTX5_9ALTE|nr:AlpA family phage regulatory protein [Aestuariibacter sp. P117]MDT0596099.1 AlpA family phage regulatory protein [Aestuariibacter sp. P117]